MKDIKSHEWIRGVDWDRVLQMDYEPPIVPGPHECCIDEEFLNLPLDFEDSSVPVPTERRQSCYYESTIMLKTIISDKNTLKNSQLQQLYNNLNDTRGNISFLLDDKKDEQKSPSVEPRDSEKGSGSGARIQPQDIDQGGTTETPDSKPPIDPNEGNIVIEGLENFSFTDTPEEEIQLRVHFNKFIEQMQINEINLQKK